MNTASVPVAEVEGREHLALAEVPDLQGEASAHQERTIRPDPEEERADLCAAGGRVGSLPSCQ